MLRDNKLDAIKNKEKWCEMIRKNEMTKPYRFWEYVLFFFGYACIGYLYETILEVVIYRWGFSNRGVLFGPWLPVYGVGVVIFVLLWYRLIQNKPSKTKVLMIPVIFLLTMATATLLELVTSYLLEWTMGSWPWQTYTSYALNYQGRIALNPSLRFGLGGVLFLYSIQPFFDRKVGEMGESKVKYLSMTLLALVFVDVVVSLIIK